jgi:hypothetical protein
VLPLFISATQIPLSRPLFLSFFLHCSPVTSMAPSIESTPESVVCLGRCARACRSSLQKESSLGASSQANFAVPFLRPSPGMANWSSSPSSIHLVKPSTSLKVSVRIFGTIPFVSASPLASD